MDEIDRIFKELEYNPTIWELEGARFINEYSMFHRDENIVTVIRGIPPCPMCDKQLSLRPMPSEGETYWHCTSCGTQWETADLIQALNDVIVLALVKDMEAEDNKEDDRI